MKVLFASHTGCDWLASTLYQGLLEVVGEENLFDACGGERSIPGSSMQAKRLMGSECGFDLLVLNACFLREFGWDWVCGHLGVETRGVPGGRLLPHAKIVYVEGWDLPWDINPPPFACDAYFRREIQPGINYPYPCEPMHFAVPEKLFDWNVEKTVDVCCLINCKDIGVRHDILNVLSSLKQYQIAVNGAGVPHADYVHTMKRAKLAICPPGAGSDCMHQWEAVAYGAIPVFVGHPNVLRDPWFGDNQVFSCNSPAQLPDLIYHALHDCDLYAMRYNLYHQAKNYHTARRRAERLLRKVGL